MNNNVHIFPTIALERPPCLRHSVTLHWLEPLRAKPCKTQSEKMCFRRLVTSSGFNKRKHALQQSLRGD